MWNNTLKTS